MKYNLKYCIRKEGECDEVKNKFGQWPFLWRKNRNNICFNQIYNNLNY